MQHNVTKIVLAFLAGIVLAAGGMFVYVRNSKAPVPPPAQAAQVSPPPAPAVPEQEAAQPGPSAPAKVSKAQEQEAEPVEKPKSVEKAATANPVRHRVSKPKPMEKSEPAPAVVDQPPAPASNPAPAETAVNTPPPPSAPDPAASGNQVFRPEDNPAPPKQQPRTVTLPTGTTVTVRLNEPVSTEHNYAGDAFRAVLDSPVVIDGMVIAEKGAKVLGRVIDSQKAGRIKGISELQLALTELQTTDGQRVQIDTATWTQQGQTSKKGDAARIGTGAAIGAIIGAIAGGGKGAAIGAGAGGAAGTGVVLGTRGKPVELAAETRITFRLQNPVTITEKLN